MSTSTTELLAAVGKRHGREIVEVRRLVLAFACVAMDDLEQR